jgi:hypothetical protein
MITTVTLAAGSIAVVTAIAAVLMRLIGHRRSSGIMDRSIRDLGPVSQQWLNGHRTEPL